MVFKQGNTSDRKQLTFARATVGLLFWKTV